MTYIKICLSDVQSLSATLKLLKQYEGKSSEKAVTELFSIEENFIKISNDKISRKTINTIKWIDDIIDKDIRGTDKRVGLIVSTTKSDLVNRSGEIGKFIIIKPTKELKEVLKNWSLIMVLKELKEEIIIDFDFYSALKYSKTINLNTKKGVAQMQAVEVESHGKLFTIFSKDVDPSKPVNVRIHHMCETSEIFDSLHCDCREQLEAFKEIIFDEGGVLIYAHEEGRGFGLAHKVNAYYNTEVYGLDTVDAMVKEAGESENRMFEVPADIIHQMGIEEVKIWTNNPLKMQPLIDRGIKVNRKEAWYELDSDEAKKYTEDKRKRMNHIDINH